MNLRRLNIFTHTSSKVRGSDVGGLSWSKPRPVVFGHGEPRGPWSGAPPRAGTMLAALLRRNVSQRLSVVLLAFGFVWGLMLMRYTLQQPRHQSSAELRQQILDLSKRYVKVLTEENQNAPGPQGTSMAGYADLKRTIAVLLDDILQRLVKLEGKVDTVMNGSLTNSTHSAGGLPVPAPGTYNRPTRQEMPPVRPESPDKPGQGR